jgi:hypothetical protein
VALCFPGLALFPLSAWCIEAVAARYLQSQLRQRAAMLKRDGESKAVAAWFKAASRSSELLLLACNLANTTVALALPCAVLTYTEADPLPGFALVIPAFILWMKLVSYSHCCWDLRRARRAGEVRSGERGAPDADAE